jgi:hypothetical protein
MGLRHFAGIGSPLRRVPTREAAFFSNTRGRTRSRHRPPARPLEAWVAVMGAPAAIHVGWLRRGSRRTVPRCLRAATFLGRIGASSGAKGSGLPRRGRTRTGSLCVPRQGRFPASFVSTRTRQSDLHRSKCDFLRTAAKHASTAQPRATASKKSRGKAAHPTGIRTAASTTAT